MQTTNRQIQRWIQVVLLLFAIFTTVACVWVVRVSADDGAMPEARRASIVQNCDSIKLRLKQLQTSDASTRVTLGQNYENLLTKLMDAMNSRLAANRLDSGDLPTIAAEFDRNLGYFRKNYISYDQKVDDLRKVNCAKNPESFYKQLETVRNLRGALRLNYTRLGELTNNYKAELKNVLGGGEGAQN
ncbi:MAG: hypothetical protein LBL84_02070 [Candidatus Nomurabacteria bacterium]|jgi:hypothetical protein|nr:hypothetical protein [Candidatus Nomurabacteria bacterium]